MRRTALLILAAALVSALSALAAIRTAPAELPRAVAARPTPAQPRPAPAPAPPPPSAPAEPAPTLVVKRVLPLDAIGFGDWAWDDKDVPPGPLVMTVDRKAQTISVFRHGQEIGAAVILYGADEKPTPLGRFAVIGKFRDHVSSLYGAPMPFTLRLTDDGISIHGSDVKWGYATHGCIGVPLPFAKKLFEASRLGDVVLITEGRLLKVGDRIA